MYPWEIDTMIAEKETEEQEENKRIRILNMKRN